MMIPDTYLMAAGVGGVAVLALLFYWGYRRGKAPAKNVYVQDPDDWVRKHIEPMEAPAPAPVLNRQPSSGEAPFQKMLEGAFEAAARNSTLKLKITLPADTKMKLFEKDGWAVSGELEIGGEDKEEPKPTEQKKEKPESVT